MSNQVPSRWKPVQFSELLSISVRNGIYKPKQFHGSGAKIVNMGELFAHPRLGAVAMKRIEVDDSEIERFGLKKYDLLFARRSLVAEGAGKCSIVMEVDEPTVFESSIIRARPNPQIADPLFLYYFWSSPAGLHLLKTIRRQVAVAGITGTDLQRLDIPLPPLPEQHRIASLLGSLDDKIEHNRRTAQALERLARAIFKAWFIDFEPVKAKAEGATSFPSMPQDVFDALPTTFVDTEIGPVPEGWGPGKLGDVLLEYRDSVRPSELEDDTPYIGLEHMPRRSIRLAKWGEVGSVTSNKARFKAGDFLFGKLRPYFHKVGVAPLDGVCSTDIVVMRPKSPEWFAFGLGHVSSDAFVAYTNACSSGTKMPRTNWRDMSNYRIVLPSSRLVRTYDKLVSPFVDSMRHGIFESKKLSELRDYLLPTLILGRNDHDEIMM